MNVTPPPALPPCRHTARFLTIWLAMLPLGLWERYHWSMLPVIALIGFLLLGIGEEAGRGGRRGAGRGGQVGLCARAQGGEGCRYQPKLNGTQCNRGGGGSLFQSQRNLGPEGGWRGWKGWKGLCGRDRGLEVRGVWRVAGMRSAGEG